MMVYCHEPEGVMLLWGSSNAPGRQLLTVESVPCGRGERLWWRCPLCDGRCARVYFRSDRFACRGCQDLRYKSKSESPETRAWRRVVKTTRRIGPDADTSLPRRPVGMRRTVFEKRRRAWFDAYGRWEGEVSRSLAALFARQYGPLPVGVGAFDGLAAEVARFKASGTVGVGTLPYERTDNGAVP